MVITLIAAHFSGGTMICRIWEIGTVKRHWQIVPDPLAKPREVSTNPSIYFATDEEDVRREMMSDLLAAGDGPHLGVSDRLAVASKAFHEQWTNRGFWVFVQLWLPGCCVFDSSAHVGADEGAGKTPQGRRIVQKLRIVICALMGQMPRVWNGDDQVNADGIRSQLRFRRCVPLQRTPLRSQNDLTMVTGRGRRPRRMDWS